ncbi:hypothetical protein SLEP1_g6438 [Rubroshorea leprosula]|uniref:Pumilio homolog 23 n=1 Tax=Rubroshorea leprosula TaxID=152421 RepID=A0AAV5I559_9ROSI|nr:hypothetical protein SLEP1_g6438 [Rubroshorea leprosula]
MVSVGSKALPSRRSKDSIFVEDSFMGEEDKSHKHSRKKKGMGRKPKKGSFGFDGDGSNMNVSGRGVDGTAKSKKYVKHQSTSDTKSPLVRKQIDPETTKYFMEITNLFESNGVDLEERSVICGNALEETRGKELELATDYILSHTMQTLLEGCDVDHLCGFLRGCAKVFPAIAMDRAGSHVAETALKSLAMHLQDSETYSVIEETLSMICKVIVGNPIDVMCNCYGSHVLRRLLSLCKGVPGDSSEVHGAKASTILAERLNSKTSQLDGNDSQNLHQGFPDLLKLLVSGMINCTRKDIDSIVFDQYSSLVLQACLDFALLFYYIFIVRNNVVYLLAPFSWQTTLKLLAGDDEELLQIIPVLLGCNTENTVEGNLIEMSIVNDLIESMQETAYSHLMEVILEVAPKSLYNEMFTKVFRNSLFKLSSHHCGNFVVQALLSHTREKDQMEFIWEELGQKFGDLLGMGRPGVIASLIAACQRLNTHQQKCCQALAEAVSSKDGSPKFIVPRLLFLDSYFNCEDKSNWNWTSGVKMHIIGSLILQAIFKFENEYIQPYIMSITSMESEHVLEAAKDAGGARVIEAFLDSNGSVKQKRRLVVKLRGNFGELAMHPSGSFTIERCFTISNMSLKESIVSELVALRTELSKTRQGPFLLRKLDVDGYAAKPDHWRSRLEAKQSAYKEFYSTFGAAEDKTSKEDTFLSDAYKRSQTKELNNMRKEIDDRLTSTAPSLGVSEKNKKSKKRKDVQSEDASGSSKMTENAVSNFLSSDRRDKKRHGKDRRFNAYKKMKA